MIDEFLNLAQATKVVPCFVGAPGVGKTAQIEAWAKKNGRVVEKLSLTDRDRGDYLGLPYRKIIKKKVKSKVVEQTITAWADADWFSRLTDKSVLFLDEISNAAPDVRASMLPLLSDRFYNGVKIPNGCVICCATNPLESSENGYEFSEALATRLSFIYVGFDATATADYLERVGNPLAEFVRQTPIMPDDTAAMRMCQKLPKTNCRTIAQAGEILKVSQSQAAKTMVRGLLDEAIAERVFQFMATEKSVIKSLYELDGSDTDNDEKIIERLSQICSDSFKEGHAESEHHKFVQEIVDFVDKYRRFDIVGGFLSKLVDLYYQTAKDQLIALNNLGKQEQEKSK